jgi:hypothetical protein
MLESVNFAVQLELAICLGENRYELELDLGPPLGMSPDGIVAPITALPDVELLESVSVVD